MKSIHFETRATTLRLPTEGRLLDALVDHGEDILRACGGRGICATCHVFVTKGMEQLTPMGSREQKTLSRVAHSGPLSRLACQAQVIGDGVEIERPNATYVTSTADLEKLIGKRATRPILHPVDGRVLIQKGKIMTRTAILSLMDTDFSIPEQAR